MIQRSYTGRNAGVEIPNSDRIARSQERMDDLLMKANEYRLQSFKENQNRFLKMGDIDLDTYISSANATAQGKLVDDYNNKAQSILKSRGSFENFQTQDWVELQKGRKMLESAQAKMNADYERFKLDEQVIKRDNGRTLDLDEWAAIKEKYLKEGVYTEDPLPVKEVPFENLLNDYSKNFTGEQEVELDTSGVVNGIRQKRKAWANMTQGQADNGIKELILYSEGGRKNVMRRFAEQPIQEQLKWLDADKSGTIDKNERGDENAIIAWAQQYEPFKKTIIREKSTGYSNITQPKTEGANKPNYNVKALTPETVYGKHSFSDMMNVGAVPQPVTEAQTIPLVYDYSSGKPVLKEVNQNAQFTVTGYSPSEDVILVKISNDSDAFSAGDIIALPAEGYSELLKAKPLFIDRSSFKRETAPKTTKGKLY
jgi:hypothetical protein